MAWTLVGTPDAVGFSDGGTPGHVYTIPGGAPSAGDLDILTINSNGTVTTPSGWTLSTNASQVNNQGAYVFWRVAVGGEGSTVTIVTSVSTSTALGWSRWRGQNAFDFAAKATVTSSAAMTTPPLSTGALATSNDLVVVLGALHNVSSAVSSPVWSSGYTALGGISQVGGSAASQFAGYKTGAGTASESPNVTWSGGTAFNRTIIAVMFTPAGGSTVNGTAALAGAGTVSGASGVMVPGTAALAGVGSLAATSGATVAGSATLAAAGALAAVGLSGRLGNATTASAGTLTAVATVRVSGTAALAGAGSATAAGAVTVGATAALVAAGSLTATIAGALTHRPDTGTTVRPGGGVTPRPFTGITTRP